MAKMFPIQTQRGAKPHPTMIPWEIAELAYSVYAAKYGTQQTLQRLSERGGFGPCEMDMYCPDWRERCDNNVILLNACKAVAAAFPGNESVQVTIDMALALRQVLDAINKVEGRA